MAGYKNATYLANALRQQGERPLRVFRLAYPIIKAEVYVKKEQDSKSFHIIERYMDRLITGDGTDGVILIPDKDQLFALLGIDEDAYDVSDHFYRDLLNCGHFQETPMGLVGTQVGWTSLKTDRKIVPQNTRTRIFLDAYDLKVCLRSLLALGTHSGMEMKEDKGAIVPTLPDHLFSPELVEELLEKCDYGAEDLDLRGLPSGLRSLRLTEEEAEQFPRLAYLDLYLVIFPGGAHRLIDRQTGEEVQGIDLADPARAPLRNMLQHWIDLETDQNLLLTPCSGIRFFIRERGVLLPDIRVVQEGYEIPLKEERLRALLYAPQEAEHRRLAVIRRILAGEVWVLEDHEAGKLVRLVPPEEVRPLLEAICTEPERLTQLADDYFEQTEA